MNHDENYSPDYTKHPYVEVTVPAIVDLVCLGESSRSDWWRYCLEKDRQPEAESRAVWTVNRGVMLFAADVCFVLDEIESEAARDPRYGEALKVATRAGTPALITTRKGGGVSSDFAETVAEFPARAVMLSLGMDPEKDDPYWHNSVPMIVAYAMAIGVQTLRIWGADYTMPDGRVLEADRANLEFWLGRARQSGMEIQLPPNTTLMNNNTTRGLKVYGLVDQSAASARSFLNSGGIDLWA